MQTSTYGGLRNQDSSCYFKSLLQCLFFTRELREAILSCNNVDDSHNMYHLQKLCREMTDDSLHNTEKIIQYFRINNVCQIELVKCFPLLMNKIIEDKEEIWQPYQVKMVQSTTCHEGSYLMRLEESGQKLTLPVHKCASSPTVYPVYSYSETLPQILVIHSKRDPVDINVEVSVPSSLTLEAEKQLATTYELFMIYHHFGEFQDDQYITKIKSVENENDRWYRFIGRQVQEIPEEQISSDEQHSAITSLLLYHRVNSDARPIIDSPAGPFAEPMGSSVTDDTDSQHSRKRNTDVSGDGECWPAGEWNPSSSAPSSNSRKGTCVGLRNQGSTCYLNSLLQCLFFTPELREAILSYNNRDSGIICQLKKLFEEMKRKKSAPSTVGITECLGVRDVHQQQDVAEYFRILMNTIVEDNKEIQKLYQVEMVHSITCYECDQETRIENPVLSLTLSLDKGNCEAYSVHQALDDVQKDQYLTGDEQFYCEKCKSKQDATSRCYFETVPKILVLNLKRYQFDGNRFTKLHYEVSVPFSLTVNLKKQTVENVDFPLSSQGAQYELFAMCCHSGEIHGGHYVAEIKSSEHECWCSFNDTVVSEMPKDWSTMDATNSCTAYLLMYRMVNPFPKPRMYLGLRNQSCTCYLNSLLHCLFFTPELRKAILRFDKSTHAGDSVIMRHLQQLFKNLMTSDSSPTTEKIARALEKGNVHQQLDVKECFQLLMNKIIEDKEEIRQLYQVKIVHLITCCGCSHREILKKSDLSICLSVQEQNSNCALYSVDHALADMQKKHLYIGDGQHYCQRCGNRSSTLRSCFESLPQILVIHLKRDQVNAGVSVPLSLTLKTDQQLGTNYELFGMCHLIGAIHGNHYMAEVKSLEDNHWYHVEDRGVSEVSEKQISSEVQNSATVSLLMYHKMNSDTKPEPKKIEKNTGRRNRGKQISDPGMHGRILPGIEYAERMRAADPQQKSESKKKKKYLVSSSL